MKQPMMMLMIAAGLAVFATPAAASHGPGVDQLGSFPTTRGAPCTLSAGNGESVWPGNVLVLTDGEIVREFAGIEDASNTSLPFNFIATGDVVSVAVRFETHTSIDVVVECGDIPPSTTTSSVPPPEESTTTGVPDCVDDPRNESCDTTTTSSIPEETTTTTAPPPEETTTTTTAPDPCAVEGSCLPDTGAETWLLVGLGSVFAALGSAAMLLTRRTA